MTLIPDYALSIRQPWAWAIVHGGKNIENRYWRKPNPGLKFRGPVAIHAATGMTRAEYEHARDFMASIGVTCPAAADLQRGGIIGVAVVSDIVKGSLSPWFFGRLGLVMTSPEPVPFVPVSGALGFFKWQRSDAVGPVAPAKWMLPAVDRQKPLPQVLCEADLFGKERGHARA